MQNAKLRIVKSEHTYRIAREVFDQLVFGDLTVAIAVDCVEDPLHALKWSVPSPTPPPPTITTKLALATALALALALAFGLVHASHSLVGLACRLLLLVVVAHWSLTKNGVVPVTSTSNAQMPNAMECQMLNAKCANVQMCKCANANLPEILRFISRPVGFGACRAFGKLLFGSFWGAIFQRHKRFAGGWTCLCSARVVFGNVSKVFLEFFQRDATIGIFFLPVLQETVHLVHVSVSEGWCGIPIAYQSHGHVYVHAQ